MNRKGTKHAAWAGPVILACLSVLLMSSALSAQPAVPAAPSYNVAASMKDNLTGLMGKDVYVSLRSGKVYQGYVKAVGDHFVHLEKLAGKDFYDALIRLDDISAIEARFRGGK